ncbi:MAG: MATE family efflux transporter [Oscillospiraceae bacterium]|nr:MATE family efflux transporter [Oscillospiraceae bacterium]
MTKDLTKGKPIRLILSFTLPLIGGNLFQQLYNMVDMMVVSRFLGEDALGAVGATGSVGFLIIGFALGLTGGFSVLVAQRFGAGDERGVRKATAQSVYLALGFTAVLTAVSMASAKQLLIFMNTPPAFIERSYHYVIIIFGGIGATMAYNLLAGILRALGDSKTPLYFLILSSVLNVVLDVVFIACFHMDVEGAAWATVISQGLSAVLCVVYMARRYPILRFQKSDWLPERWMLRQHLYIALPMALQFSITAVGGILVQGALNKLGPQAVTAFTAGNKLEQVFQQPLVSLGVAMATYCGQNLGAKQYDRLREGVRKTTFLSIGMGLFSFAIAAPFGRVILEALLSIQNEEILSQAHLLLCVSLSCHWLLGLLFLHRNALQGVGKSFVPMMAGVCELLMRVLATIFLIGPLGFLGVCLAGPLAWMGAEIPLFSMWVYTARRFGLKKEAAKGQTETFAGEAEK